MNSAFYVIVIFVILIILLPFCLNKEHKTITDKVRENSAGSFVKLSMGYTHYEISGPENGRTVILIHGFSIPFYTWDKTFKPLTDAGFRVLRYDIYGRGLSDRPKAVYDKALFVNQLRELMDSLSINTPATLIGNSMGGAVAAAFTAYYPERVDKIVLIDPFCEKENIGPLAVPFLGEYIGRIFFLPFLPEKQLDDFYKPENYKEWPKLYLEQMTYRGFSYAILSTVLNFIRNYSPDDYEKMGKAGKSILLLWGTEDKVLNISGATRLRLILKPEFEWIKEAGHIPHYERPDVVNPLIIKFLSKD